MSEETATVEIQESDIATMPREEMQKAFEDAVRNEQAESSDPDIDTVVEKSDAPLDTVITKIEETTVPPEVDDLQKLKAKLEEQERYIQQQKTTTGQLHAAVRQMQGQFAQPEISAEELNDLWMTDPTRAAKIVVDAEERRREQARNEDAQQIYQRAEEAKAIVSEYAPDLSPLMPVMEQIMREDGANDAQIAAIKSDPYINLDKAMLFGLTKRAILVQENASLKEKIKQLEANSQTIVKKIDDAAKRPSALNAGSGASPSTSMLPLTDAEIAKMTPAQLKEAFEQAKKEGL
jgi:hypothetical protein